MFPAFLSDVRGPPPVTRVSCADGEVVSSGVGKTLSFDIKHPARSWQDRWTWGYNECSPETRRREGSGCLVTTVTNSVQSLEGRPSFWVLFVGLPEAGVCLCSSACLHSWGLCLESPSTSVVTTLGPIILRMQERDCDCISLLESLPICWYTDSFPQSHFWRGWSSDHTFKARLRLVIRTRGGWAEQHTGCGRRKRAHWNLTQKKGTAMATGSALRNTSLLHNPDEISSHNCKLFPCFENNPDANFKCLSRGHTMKKICLADNLQNHRTQAQTSLGSIVLFAPVLLPRGIL